MGYERDEAMRQQEATEAMIRMRDPAPSRRGTGPHPDPRDAEIARLRVLVEDAYREGFADGSAGGSAGMDRSWKRSEACAEITP